MALTGGWFRWMAVAVTAALLALAVAWIAPEVGSRWTSGSDTAAAPAGSLLADPTPTTTANTAQSLTKGSPSTAEPGTAAAVTSPPPSSTSQCALLPVPVVSLDSGLEGSELGSEPGSFGWSGLSYRELASLRRPLVLRGPRAVWSRWGVFNRSSSGGHPSPSSRWSWSSLVRHFPSLRSYRRAHPLDQPTFASWRDLHGSPLASLSGLRREDFSQTNDVDSRCVLRPDEGERLEGEGDEFGSSHCDPLHHYVLLQAHNLPASLRADLEPLEPLVLSERPQANLWLSRASMHTHTHSDLSWNFNVQLRGSKLWTLFPPGARLRVYPDAHPHQTHTYPAPHHRPEAGMDGCAPFDDGADEGYGWQDRIDSSDAASDAATARTATPAATSSSSSSSSSRRPLSAYRTELHEGEVLVVPPGWSHHVSSMSRSVSLNVWSNTNEYLLLRDMKDLQIPVQHEWGTEQRVAAAMIYMEQLVTRVDAMLRETGTGAPINVGQAHSPPSSSSSFGAWVRRWLVAPRYHPDLMRTLLSNAQARTKAGRAEAEAVARQCGPAVATEGPNAAVKRARLRWTRPDMAESGVRHEWEQMLEHELLPRFADMVRETQPVDPTHTGAATQTVVGTKPGTGSAVTTADTTTASAEMDLLIRTQGLHLTHSLLANYVESMLTQVLDEDSRLLVHFMHRCLGAVSD